MDEKAKDDEKKVILVKDAKDDKLKAVRGVDKEGKPKMVEPTENNLADLLAVNTNDPALEAFFKKFMEEAQKDVKAGLPDVFIMTKDVLVYLIKADFAQALLEHFRADPAKNSARYPPSSLWTSRRSTRQIWSARVSSWKTWNLI